MNLYADTSLLISYYINDSHSVSAQAVLHATTDPLPFTGLHRLEMRNALALGVFRRILTSAQVSAAWSDVERDLRSGRLVPQPVNWSSGLSRGSTMGGAPLSPRIGCRSLDVLHVSLAKQLDAKEFFTFDERQKSLALALGLTVKP